MNPHELTVLTTEDCSNIIIVRISKSVIGSDQQILQHVVSILQEKKHPLKKSKGCYLLAEEQCDISTCLSDREDCKNIVFCSLSDREGCKICWENFAESCAFFEW